MVVSMLVLSTAGAPDPVASGLVAPLGSILRQLSAGGGAAGINIDDITVELEKLTKNYPFQARPAVHVCSQQRPGCLWMQPSLLVLPSGVLIMSVLQGN